MTKIKALTLIPLALACACNDHNNASVKSENPKDLDAECETQSDASGIRLKCSNGVAVRLAAIDLERFRGPAGPQGAAAPALPAAPKLRAYDANGAQLGDSVLTAPSYSSGLTLWDEANSLVVSYSGAGLVVGSNAYYPTTDCSGPAYVPNNYAQGSVVRVGASALYAVTELQLAATLHSNSTGTTCTASNTNPGFVWSQVIPYANASVPAQIALPLKLRFN